MLHNDGSLRVAHHGEVGNRSSSPVRVFSVLTDCIAITDVQGHHATAFSQQFCEGNFDSLTQVQAATVAAQMFHYLARDVMTNQTFTRSIRCDDLIWCGRNLNECMDEQRMRID